MLIIASFEENVVTVGQDSGYCDSHSQGQKSESYFNSQLIMTLGIDLSSKFRSLGFQAGSKIWYITNTIFSLSLEDEKGIIFVKHTKCLRNNSRRWKSGSKCNPLSPSFIKRKTFCILSSSKKNHLVKPLLYS